MQYNQNQKLEDAILHKILNHATNKKKEKEVCSRQVVAELLMGRLDPARTPPEPENVSSNPKII